MRFAQIVMGPAGCGKSTYCAYMEKHAESTKRHMRIVNLDPAAEYFAYHPLIDVRDLIEVKDVMQDKTLNLGPNGALLYCMEYLTKHLDWLYEQLGEGVDGDYLLFDCPGQIELYTHMEVMKTIVKQLESWNFRVCGIYTIDAHFLTDGTKFIAGALSTLSTMVNLEIPHVSLLTKMDMMSKCDKKKLGNYLEPEAECILVEEVTTEWNLKFQKLTSAIGQVLDNYSLVKFYPLDMRKSCNMESLILMIDMVLGVSEDADVVTKDFVNEMMENGVE